MLKFRPHHFLCTLCFQGKGYSPAFVKNYVEIVEQLKDEQAIKIEVVNRTDSICSACPHQQGARCGNGEHAEQKIQTLDAAHKEDLNWQVGELLTWQEAKIRIKNKLDLETFHATCKTCSWKASGICEGVLKEFLTQRK